MLQYIVHYILTTLVFLGIDAIWLGIIAKNLYATKIGHLMAENPNFLVAGIFYLLFVVGILIFAVYPAVEKQSFVHALMLGALFGFFTYATYDLTNLATLRDWPMMVTVIDILWGTILNAVVSGVGYFIVMSVKF